MLVFHTIWAMTMTVLPVRTLNQKKKKEATFPLL